ncbi:MAG: hypothetical protein ACSHYC_09480 [Alphaproteobacteria bacterium]
MDLTWIFDGLDKPDKTRIGLAKALGRDVSVVSKILSGKRRLAVEDEEIIRNYLEIPYGGSSGGNGISSRVVYNVAFHIVKDKQIKEGDPREFADLFLELCHYLQDQEDAPIDKIVSFEAQRRARRSSQS